MLFYEHVCFLYLHTSGALVFLKVVMPIGLSIFTNISPLPARSVRCASRSSSVRPCNYRKSEIYMCVRVSVCVSVLIFICVLLCVCVFSLTSMDASLSLLILS